LTEILNTKRLVLTTKDSQRPVYRELTFETEKSDQKLEFDALE